MIYGLAMTVAECPPIAPILWSDGTCSNYEETRRVPYGDDIMRVPLPGGGPVQNPYTGEYAPPGTFLNPFTGEAELLSATQRASMARGSGAAELVRSAAEEEALEAERLGRAMGLAIACAVRENCGLVSDGNGNPIPGAVDCRYWSECDVNGLPGNDAGLLIRPGGFQSALVELARVSGSPVRHITELPALPNPSVIPFVTETGAPGLSPYRTPRAEGGPTPAPTAPGAGLVEQALGPGPAVVLPSGEVVSSLVARASAGVEQVASGFGIPSWAVLAGAAGLVGWMVLGGRR